MAISFDLSDLCQQSGVTARTVRYYVQQGLLPSPGLGAGARYGAGHLARLRLIRRLQAEHLPLAEIRRRLETLDDGAVQALVDASPTPVDAPPSSAVEYVRAVLGGSSPRAPAPLTPAVPVAPSPASSSRRTGPVSRPAATDRAQWERIGLTPDIEVHVRRPLSREDNRRLEMLLEKAQELFRGEEV